MCIHTRRLFRENSEVAAEFSASFMMKIAEDVHKFAVEQGVSEDTALKEKV